MSTISVFKLLLIALTFSTTTNAHFYKCSKAFSKITEAKNFSLCKKLTTLGAEFAWSVHENNFHNKIEIILATKLHQDFGWLAWGVNPDKMPQMVGTRAIIGIRHENGSIFTNTYNITSDTKLGCKLTPTNFSIESSNEVQYQHISIEYLYELDYFSIRATMILPSEIYSISRLNHVWQVGYELDGTNPKKHPRFLQNVDSIETMDFKSGKPTWHVGRFRRRLRAVHGALNMMGWGTLLPIGAIIARYSEFPFGFEREKDSDHGWVRVHYSCQIMGYSLGTTGWILGLYLGNASKFYIFRTHRLYSMFIFAFATLQMLALTLKPDRNDEYRKYWNMYHHFLGYGLLIVISLNMFHGIGILKPDHKIWKWIYIGILLAFGIIVTVLEIYTWTKFHINKKSNNTSTQEAATGNSASQQKGEISSQTEEAKMKMAGQHEGASSSK